MKVYELPQSVTELLGFTEFHNMIGRERSSPGCSFSTVRDSEWPTVTGAEHGKFWPFAIANGAELFTVGLSEGHDAIE